MIQQTSLEAYAKDVLPNLGQRQRDVYKALQMYGVANNKDLAKYMKLPINSVTPRVLELRKKGLVVLSHIGYDIQRRKCHYWKVKESNTEPLQKDCT